MKDIKFMQGDVRDKIKELENHSIDCVVTSPPYWGLRDYGTAKWEGGDPNCDHRVGRFTRGGLSEKQSSNKGSGGHVDGNQNLKFQCPKCNAVKVDYVWGGDENCEHEWSKESPRRRRSEKDIVAPSLTKVHSTPNLKETDMCHKCGAWMGGYGLEPTPEQYIKNTLLIFDELKRVLKPQGTVWWNIGDSYNATNGFSRNKGYWKREGRKGGSDDKKALKHEYIKVKDLMMIPARIAIAVAEHGWYLRSEIIWHKPNPMPESVKDRPTSSHEKIYLFAKNRKYYYDADAIRVP